MESNEGAFPRSHSEDSWNEEQHFAQKGLSKRELFAAIAMQGLLSGHPKQVHGHNQTAEIAIKHADALIEELSKVEKKYEITNISF